MSLAFPHLLEISIRGLKSLPCHNGGQHRERLAIVHGIICAHSRDCSGRTGQQIDLQTRSPQHLFRHQRNSTSTVVRGHLKIARLICNRYHL